MTARRRPRWLLPLVLLAVCGVLGTMLYEQIRRAEPVGDANAGSAASGIAIDPLPPEAVFSMPPQATYAAIVDRPLFSPTRRPETGTAFIPADPGSDVSLKLVGIFITTTERFALVKLGDNDQLVRVDVGGEIAGWKVTEIYELGIVLERDEETLELPLQYDDTPPPPPEPTEEAVPEQPAEEAPPPDTSTDTGAGATTQ